MAAKKKTTKKTAEPAVRKLKQAPYQSFRLSKRIKHDRPRVKGALRIFAASLRHLKKNWRVFAGIIVVYLLLTIVLVKGFGVSTGVAELKNNLEEVLNGAQGEIVAGFTLFTLLLTSSASTASEQTSLYQSIFLVVMSLTVIWTLRQTHAGTKVKTKEAFYKSMYPLVPFVLVITVISLQLLPIFAATWLYGAVLGGGFAVTAIEQAVWWVILGLMVLFSLYMLSSSIFAFYIVTLPDMTPMKALRSARELVRHRRWTIARKVLALPLLILIVGFLIMVPIIIFVTPAAEWTFFVLNMAVLAVVHSYMYSLYRELL